MRISLSFCALVASAGLAFAADPVGTDAFGDLPKSLPTWTGAYVGGDLGWLNGAGDQAIWEASNATPTSGFLSSGSLANSSTATNTRSGTNVFRPGGKLATGDALGFGLFGGYQHQMDYFVMGLEGDFAYGPQNTKPRAGGALDIVGTYAHPTCATCTGDTAKAAGLLEGTVRSRILWTSSVRMRAGVLATPQMLVFATAGVGFAGVKRSLSATGSIDFTDDAATPVSQAKHALAGAKKSSEMRLGWTLGFGVDYRVAESWTLRAEYRYADYGTGDLVTAVTSTCTETVTGACTKLAPGESSMKARFSDTSHAVKVGLSYQFGAASGAVVSRY